MVGLIKKIPISLNLTAILTIAFMTLGALMLLISGGLHLFFNIRTQRVIIANNQKLIAQEAAHAVSDYIREKVKIFETAIWIADPLSPSSSNKKLILESLLGLQPAIRKLVLLNAQDRVIAQAARLSTDTLWRFSDYFNRDILTEIHKKETYLGSIRADPLSREPLMVIGIPITDMFNDFSGSLVAEMNLKFMWDLIEKIKVGVAGFAYVVDKQGKLIAFRDKTRVLKDENVGNLKVVGDFISTPTLIHSLGVSTYRGITGSLMVGTYVPLGNPDWAVVTEVPWSEAYREIIRQVAISLGITLVMAIIAGIMGVYLARRLAVPLVNLMETATRIAEGERELQATVSGPKEVSSLAMAFNSMTAQLRHSLENLEQRVAERTAQLEAANKELEAFSYSVSHDLRTPLRAIEGYTRILLEDYSKSIDDEGKRLCGVITSETRRMSQLIDDLLSFSRLSRSEIKISKINMNTLIHSIIEELSTVYDKSKMDIFIDDLPEAKGDRDLLHQVWTNLISNAFKFTAKKEHPEIEIKGDIDKNNITYSIKDNGVGFDMHYYEKLFGVFQRLHSSKDFDGTGVGLAIVQRIVHRHGGKIRADAEPNKGATFFFTLPDP